MKNLTLLLLSVFCYTNSLSQTSNVVINVSWPNWSSENKVELYDPNGNIINPIISNGYNGVGNAAYTYSENYGALPNADNYTITVYDFYGDDWNGNGSMEVIVDGVNTFQFDGDFDNNVTSGNPVEISKSFSFNVQDPPAPGPGVPIFYEQFAGDTRQYIEYIPGNLPIIISAPHGGVKQSGSTVGGINYPDNDSTLPDRNCGINERDDNTDILIREIQKEIFNQTGCYAHVIISNLHRSKLDPNRELNEATCGDADAIDHWNAWHNFIDQASTSVTNNWGKGLYIDLHGQSHTVPRIEIGYRITSNDLNNTATGHLNTVTNTSIEYLRNNNLNSLDLEQLVRGTSSLGELFQLADYYPHTSGTTNIEDTSSYYSSLNYPSCGQNGSTNNGYRAVPSASNYGINTCDDTRPNGNAYFNGFYYNNERHGSGASASDGQGGGGTIDAIMTEVNRRVRDLGTYDGRVFDTRPQTLVPFAKDYANVILDYIDIHYNNFTSFNYSNSSYDITDTDPAPNVMGVPNGVFSSTAGLTIDMTTGIIDLSTSTVGNYIITYEAGACGYYKSTYNLEITDNTLGVINFENIDFKLYPNPTNGIISFKSSVQISDVKVFNLLGQEILKLNSNKTEDSIDFSHLKVGSYIVKFYNNTNTIGSKVIIKN
ncbi:T9SS type A sorting domain-containing protein [Olleya sp. YS]|uniref:T9SS type A sorting domain-containing protein n=1 Tax=Olleya sp. YS TaxID=3028318 RepID=UPI00243419D4|nr:T9SS type A sorting domain-containing protein [Olleya sp. YS]WGD33706.1 T9SS type A sorting domain-containing protein [Olleya sp. YS]